MADVDRVAPELEGDAPKQDGGRIVKLRPTLFIGVGGTGLEVMLRVRRRILNAVWGPATQPVRLSSLADFPVAQFMHLDLDQTALLDTGKSQTTDLMADLVKLDDEDRVVETFDIEKYCRSDEDLARYPHIASWSPLAPHRIRQLGIDPSKGAGQIRGIARLYFFDKYAKIRDKIRSKLNSLRDGLTKRDQFERLRLELESGQFRIVVIGSVAGGTGGGTFIDVGWLAGWIANSAVKEASVELVLFLPTGYASANKDRTEANGYASLMELETCMRSGVKADFVQKWDPADPSERPDQLRMSPYGEVYLVDSGNLAELHTAEQKDVYDMVADALFEDFNSAEFANKKRAVAVNQRLHKATPFNAAIPEGLYGDMKLSYYKGYSAFGQSILDTQGGVKRDIRSHRWVAAMLKAFFGVASDDAGNRATDKQRDEFMTAHMHLAVHPFSEFPDFSAKEAKQALAQGEFYDHEITDQLLVDRAGALIASVQQRVDSEIEAIASGFDRSQWPAQVEECVKRLEKDSVRDHTSTADTTEDRISRRRRELLTEISRDIRDRLYNYLDNKEFGGLEFVLSLVEQIKTRLEDPSTGLIQRLTNNAGRYQQIKDALRAYEFDRLMGNLRQTMGGGLLNTSLLGSREKQARAILDQIKVEIGNYLKFHLRSKAAGEAAVLLRGVSQGLGDRVDVDAAGNARWSGLVGELQAGRHAVLSMLGDIDKRVALLNDDMKKEHATYLQIDTPEQEVPLPPTARLREWADEAFKDQGGSRSLFPKLGNAQERGKLFTALRRMADEQMSRALGTPEAPAPDPLVEALKALPAIERQRRFSDLLRRAMPWVDANLEREYKPSSDQYRCYLGVSSAEEWGQFRDELFAQVPTQTGITSQQVSFVTAGIPGRVVCYSELSGIPLAVLRGIDAWRTSYQKEKDITPVHTVRDPTKFTHPRVPTMGELAQLAEDFNTFLLGVMLRVLRREPNSAKISPPGQYQFMIGPGDDRRMGNERAFRQNGLPYNYRQHIHEAVLAKVELLDKTQLGALAALASVYATGVYTPQIVPTETGAEIASKGLASALAERLASELRDRARRSGLTDTELQRIERELTALLPQWTEGVPDSNTDAYDWEVREVPKGDEPRLKRIVRAEFFTPQWLEMSILKSQPHSISGLGTSVPPLGVGTPPPPPPAFEYHLVLQPGQPSGPYPAAHVQHWITSGQISPDVLTWRAGLAQWTPLNQVPELKALVAPATPPPLPGAGLPPSPPKVGD